MRTRGVREPVGVGVQPAERGALGADEALAEDVLAVTARAGDRRSLDGEGESAGGFAERADTQGGTGIVGHGPSPGRQRWRAGVNRRPAPHTAGAGSRRTEHTDRYGCWRGSGGGPLLRPRRPGRRGGGPASARGGGLRGGGGRAGRRRLRGAGTQREAGQGGERCSVPSFSGVAAPPSGVAAMPSVEDPREIGVQQDPGLRYQVRIALGVGAEGELQQGVGGLRHRPGPHGGVGRRRRPRRAPGRDAPGAAPSGAPRRAGSPPRPAVPRRVPADRSRRGRSRAAERFIARYSSSTASMAARHSRSGIASSLVTTRPA